LLLPEAEVLCVTGDFFRDRIEVSIHFISEILYFTHLRDHPVLNVI